MNAKLPSINDVVAALQKIFTDEILRHHPTLIDVINTHHTHHLQRMTTLHDHQHIHRQALTTRVQQLALAGILHLTETPHILAILIEHLTHHPHQDRPFNLLQIDVLPLHIHQLPHMITQQAHHFHHPLP